MVLTTTVIFMIISTLIIVALLSGTYTVLKVCVNHSLGIEKHIFFVSSILSLAITVTFLIVAVTGVI